MTFYLQREWLIDIAQGKIPGHSLVHKFGRNAAVASGTEEGILQISGGQFIFRTSPSTMRIAAGGNAADTAAGAGTREVTIQGIDSNLNEVTEVIATAGASASSATTTSFWRVHRAWVSDPGTYGGNNTGNIVIEDSGGAASHIMIAAAEGQTQYAGFTIPTGKTGYLLSYWGSVGSNKDDAELKIWTRKNFNIVTPGTAGISAKRLKLNFDGATGFIPYTPISPELALAALTDVWVTAVGASAGSSTISIDFEILLVDD